MFLIKNYRHWLMTLVCYKLQLLWRKRGRWPFIMIFWDSLIFLKIWNHQFHMQKSLKHLSVWQVLENLFPLKFSLSLRTWLMRYIPIISQVLCTVFFLISMWRAPSHSEPTNKEEKKRKENVHIIFLISWNISISIYCRTVNYFIFLIDRRNSYWQKLQCHLYLFVLLLLWRDHRGCLASLQSPTPQTIFFMCEMLPLLYYGD